MTPPTEAPMSNRASDSKSGNFWKRFRIGQGLIVAASLLGCQALAASTQERAPVLALLSDGLMPARAVFRQGFALGEEQVRQYGSSSADVEWRTIGFDDDPVPFLGSTRSVVIAPFAAELTRFSRLAQDQQINVILPYQRGASLNQLVPLDPQGWLHPLSPSQQFEIDQLAIDTLSQGWRRIMVVADSADRAAGMAVTYTEGFEQLGGKAEPYEKFLVQQVNAGDPSAVSPLIHDVAWKRPAAIALAADPSGRLVRLLDQAQNEGRLMGASLASPARICLLPMTRLDAVSQRPWTQLSPDEQAHGPGWSSFATSHQQRWWQAPDLLAASGVDAARVVALAALAPAPMSSEGHRDPIGWLDPDAEVQSSCQAIALRQQSKAVFLEGAASDLALRPGQIPSGQATTRVIAPQLRSNHGRGL